MLIILLGEKIFHGGLSQVRRIISPHFFNGDPDQVLARARMTHAGKLTDAFTYLADYAGELVVNE